MLSELVEGCVKRLGSSRASWEVRTQFDPKGPICVDDLLKGQASVPTNRNPESSMKQSLLSHARGRAFGKRVEVCALQSQVFPPILFFGTPEVALAVQRMESLSWSARSCLVARCIFATPSKRRSSLPFAGTPCR